MTLEDHKKKFQLMVETEPTTGRMLDLVGMMNVRGMNRVDHLCHTIQSERNVRRLALHRVEEALADPCLSRDDLTSFVQFLIAESKARQEDLEYKQLQPLVMAHAKAELMVEYTKQWMQIAKFWGVI
jgi:hypothetical protein